MNDKTKYKLLLYFSLIYILFYSIYTFLKKDYEFLFSSLLLLTIIFILCVFRKRINLTPIVGLGMVIVGIIHTLGGQMYINNTRLYDIWFIHGIIKYDNISHFIGAFVATYFSRDIIYTRWKEKKDLVYVYIIFIMGFGILSFGELFELNSVILLGATDKIGDYLNNALDLFFNFLGALTATLLIFKNELKSNNFY